MREVRHQLARDKAIAWARSLPEDAVFLDCETTGFDENAEICDIAVVDAGGNVMLDTLVKPQDPIPAGATRVHGITDDMVADAPSWTSVYYRLLRILEDHTPIIIYNVDFDVRIINQVNRRHDLPEFTCDWQCAMEQYARFHGEWKENFGSYTWQKLTNAGNQMGISVEGDAHRALADTQLTRALVLAMAETRPEDPEWTLEERLRRAYRDAGMRGGTRPEEAHLMLSIRMIQGFEMFGSHESWGVGFEVCDGEFVSNDKSLEAALDKLLDPESKSWIRRTADPTVLSRFGFHELADEIDRVMVDNDAATSESEAAEEAYGYAVWEESEGEQ